VEVKRGVLAREGDSDKTRNSYTYTHKKWNRRTENERGTHISSNTLKKQQKRKAMQPTCRRRQSWEEAASNPLHHRIYLFEFVCVCLCVWPKREGSEREKGGLLHGIRREFRGATEGGSEGRREGGREGGSGTHPPPPPAPP